MFEKLKNQLERLRLDCLLITSSRNIFYLTGYEGFSKEEREAVILITKKNNYLLTDRRYLHELSFLENFRVEEISADNTLSVTLKKIASENNLTTAGFEEGNITYKEYEKLRKVFKNFKPLESPIEKLREIKTKEEIEKIKKACAIGDKAYAYIIKEVKAGITEENLEAKLEIFIKQNGAGVSFKPIIAFGKNSAVPHHQNSKTKLKKGMIVLLDFGVNYKGYCSDMTRTVFFGSPTPEFKRMYETVLNAQKLAIQQFNPPAGEAGNSKIKKIKGSDIDKAAREYIIQKGYETIPHNLGHGVGIEVHEKPSLSPKSKNILKNGMVFSIEPGIYLSGWGGVRIEDLFLLKGNSLEKITHSTSEIISL